MSVRGNGKTIIVTNGTQTGAIRQGGDSINPCRNAATSQDIPATNNTSSQFTSNTLLGFSTDASQTGLTGSVTLGGLTNFKCIIKYT